MTSAAVATGDIDIGSGNTMSGEHLVDFFENHDLFAVALGEEDDGEIIEFEVEQVDSDDDFDEDE